MKLKLALGAFALSAPPLYLGFESTSPVWQSFFAGLSSSLVVLGVGILAINLYLESASRRDAVKALFALSQEAIAHFHNDWLDSCWAEFGRETYGKIGKEFIAAKLDVNALQKEVRNKIYGIYANSAGLQKRILDLETTLAELTRMTGWSLDANLLTASLIARTQIAKLKSVALDGSAESIDRVTEYLFHIDATTQASRSTLMQLAGVQEKD